MPMEMTCTLQKPTALKFASLRPPVAVHIGFDSHPMGAGCASAPEAKGASVQAPLPAHRPPNVCLGCGKEVAAGSMHCATCAVEVSRNKMVEIAKQGRIASRSAESKTRLAETQRRQTTARWNWDPASQPDWLTEDFYTNQILPRLITCSLSQIASALGVSILYASHIRRGRQPHPRHWSGLAELVGIPD